MYGVLWFFLRGIFPFQKSNFKGVAITQLILDDGLTINYLRLFGLVVGLMNFKARGIRFE